MVRIKFIHSSLLMNYLWYIYAVLALSSWYAAMKPRYTKHIIPPIPSSFFIPLKKCIVGQHSVNYSNKTVTVAIIGQASLFSIKLFSNVHSNFQTLDPPLRFILCSFVSVSHLLLHILLIIGIDYKMLGFLVVAALTMVDCCKHSSMNQMAVGSRLPTVCILFSFLQTI